MKTLSMFIKVVALAGSVALLATSCGPSMTSEQQLAYDTFVTGVETAAKLADVPQLAIMPLMTTANIALGSVKSNPLKIVDTGSGVVKKDTSASAIKLRFRVKRK